MDLYRVTSFTELNVYTNNLKNIFHVPWSNLRISIKTTRQIQLLVWYLYGEAILANGIRYK